MCRGKPNTKSENAKGVGQNVYFPGGGGHIALQIPPSERLKTWRNTVKGHLKWCAPCVHLRCLCVRCVSPAFKASSSILPPRVSECWLIKINSDRNPSRVLGGVFKQGFEIRPNGALAKGVGEGLGRGEVGEGLAFCTSKTCLKTSWTYPRTQTGLCMLSFLGWKTQTMVF